MRISLASVRQHSTLHCSRSSIQNVAIRLAQLLLLILLLQHLSSEELHLYLWFQFDPTVETKTLCPSGRDDKPNLHPSSSLPSKEVSLYEHSWQALNIILDHHPSPESVLLTKRSNSSAIHSWSNASWIASPHWLRMLKISRANLIFLHKVAIHTHKAVIWELKMLIVVLLPSHSSSHEWSCKMTAHKMACKLMMTCTFPGSVKSIQELMVIRIWELYSIPRRLPSSSPWTQLQSNNTQLA